MQILLKFYIWLQSYEQFRNTQNNIKQKDLNSFFADLKNNICNIRLIPLDHVNESGFFFFFW